MHDANFSHRRSETTRLDAMAKDAIGQYLARVDGEVPDPRLVTTECVRAALWRRGSVVRFRRGEPQTIGGWEA